MKILFIKRENKLIVVVVDVSASSSFVYKIFILFLFFSSTGYPVLEKKIEFKNDLAANVEDWNKYLMASRVSHYAIISINSSVIIYSFFHLFTKRWPKRRSCSIRLNTWENGVRPRQIRATILTAKRALSTINNNK
jgi:hypothetical protein